MSKTTDSDTDGKTENEVVKGQEAPPTQRSLESASVSSSDKTPPEKVGTLSIKAISSSEIKLKWSASKASDLNHYNVYKSTKSSFKVTLGVTVPAGTSKTNSYSSTGLSPSTKYYYQIAACRRCW